MGMIMVGESPCIHKYYIVSRAAAVELGDGRVFKFSVEKKLDWLLGRALYNNKLVGVNDVLLVFCTGRGK